MQSEDDSVGNFFTGSTKRNFGSIASSREETDAEIESSAVVKKHTIIK
jgi:hypothetical protein